jgi:hypothetical protein
LSFEGTALADAFSGRIEMDLDSSLSMNISSGWTASAGSEIIVTGQLSGIALMPARLIGDPVTLAGDVEVTGANGVLRVQADATLAATLVVAVMGAMPVLINDASQRRHELGASRRAELLGPHHRRRRHVCDLGVGAGAGLVSFNGNTTWNASSRSMAAASSMAMPPSPGRRLNADVLTWTAHAGG